METLEQKPKSNKAKRYERRFGKQDHGTRGTDRLRFARRATKSAVELSPDYADNPVKQQKIFQEDKLWAVQDLSRDTLVDERLKDQKRKHSESVARYDLASSEDEYLTGDTEPEGVVDIETSDEFQDMVHGELRWYEEMKEDEAYDMNAKVDSVYQNRGRRSQNGTHRKRNRNLVRQVEKLVEGNEVSDEK